MKRSFFLPLAGVETGRRGGGVGFGLVQFRIQVGWGVGAFRRLGFRTQPSILK